MILSLEALKARHGDALLLHYGSPDAPRLALIDGGPSGVWPTLKQRLEQIRADRDQHGQLSDGKLKIDLVAVTHLDDDHVRGILDLSSDLVDSRQPAPWTVTALWLNHFDDIVDKPSDPLVTGAAMAELATAAPSEGLRSAAAVLASIPQGRRLSDNARKLGWRDNWGFDGLVMAPEKGGRAVQLDDATRVTVVSPMEHQLRDLRAKWDEYLKRAERPKPAEVAAYVDRSVFNLSSIVALVEAGGKRMLLTGDARGDQIIAGLEAAGTVAPGAALELDVLKLPHHGSDNNVEPSFFERLKATHYVISGDGEYGNPELHTLQMLSAARPDDDFTIHITYRDEIGKRVLDFLSEDAASGRSYKVDYRVDPALSLRVDLLDPVAF